MCQLPDQRTCHHLDESPQAVPEAPSRRTLLGASGLAAAGGLTALLAHPAPATAAPGTTPRPHSPMSAVLVGTSGGPIWWENSTRRGICTVVDVGGRRYLVDSGHSSAAGLRPAGLLGPLGGRNDLSAFRACFLTHLHSDHVTDLSNLLVQGWSGGGLTNPDGPFRVIGPGDRGSLPTVFPASRPTPSPFHPADPTPGTKKLVDHLLTAFATDINDRIFDAASPPIDATIAASDIALPRGTALPDPRTGKPPRITPFAVYEDDRVKVSATLVDHGQMLPSFGYRFDSEHGSVVISGDTTVSDNLNELAQGADVLCHEVIDEGWVNASIDALSVPEATKDAFRNHMFGAHTTTTQLVGVVRATGVRTLVLHHLVPGELTSNGWHRAATQLGRRVKAKVIAGRDGQWVGTRR